MTKTDEPHDDTLHSIAGDLGGARAPLGYGWYAIKAKPAREGSLAEGLKRLKLDTYRPMSTHFLRKRARKVTVKRRIFPGYIFVCCSISEHYEVIRKLDGFGRFVHRAGTDDPFKFPEMKIGDLMMRQRFGEFDDKKPKEGTYQPQKGDRVLITAGKWYGWFAEVLGLVNKKTKAKLRLDGAAAPHEVEIKHLVKEVA